MKPIIATVLLTLLKFQFLSALLDDYHCGVSTITKVLSYVSSSMCQQEKLNGCCYAHDRCYDKNFYKHDDMLMKECDYDFKHCIQVSYENEFVCSKILSVTHGSLVTFVGSFYRNLFGIDAPEEHGHSRYKRHINSKVK
ncbi:unnamed protein product [Bursaphelenchus okinawaensis]|uniref:Phospholipase A(2) n=1 Tax=Bursaphelenchus okinawaensis TaxID=465554 RepID=A0A811K9V8_9BILA|nr:unnamed protein product [Bursaphelenchus okinawaensis]CAG9098466.1 unnamed protein product [Bursaphelenchus okinawaensis]